MHLEILPWKCEEVNVSIDDGRMVLIFTENAKKCTLFTSMDMKRTTTYQTMIWIQ